MTDKNSIGNLTKMFKEIEKDHIKRFDALVQKKSRFIPTTYCQKEKRIKLTKDIKGEECLICSFFILNGGICDPL